MFPHERSLVEEMKDRPFAMIGVNSDNSAEQLRYGQEQQNLTWRSFFDGPGTDGPLASKFNVSGWPTVYLLDKDHVIRFKGHGPPDANLLETLVAEAEQKEEKK